MGEPCDRIGLTAAGRVLDKVAPAGAVGTNVRECLPDETQLVIAWPDLLAFLLARACVLFLYDLRVVLQDVGEPGGGEDFLPKVVGLESMGIGRVPRAVVVSFVKGQEP